jgi:hypothetical protein
MAKEFKSMKDVKKPKSDKPKDKTPKYLKLAELKPSMIIEKA